MRELASATNERKSLSPADRAKIHWDESTNRRDWLAIQASPQATYRVEWGYKTLKLIINLKSNRRREFER